MKQIVIDISEDLYEGIERRDGSLETEYVCNELMKAVDNGILLPKGHGRLIDISKIDEDRIESDNPIIYLTKDGEYTEAISLSYLDNLPTIIEADKEEE